MSVAACSGTPVMPLASAKIKKEPELRGCVVAAYTCMMSHHLCVQGMCK